MTLNERVETEGQRDECTVDEWRKKKIYTGDRVSPPPPPPPHWWINRWGRRGRWGSDLILEWIFLSGLEGEEEHKTEKVQVQGQNRTEEVGEWGRGLWTRGCDCTWTLHHPICSLATTSFSCFKSYRQEKKIKKIKITFSSYITIPRIYSYR